MSTVLSEIRHGRNPKANNVLKGNCNTLFHFSNLNSESSCIINPMQITFLISFDISNHLTNPLSVCQEKKK